MKSLTMWLKSVENLMKLVHLSRRSLDRAFLAFFRGAAENVRRLRYKIQLPLRNFLYSASDKRGIGGEQIDLTAAKLYNGCIHMLCPPFWRRKLRKERGSPMNKRRRRTLLLLLLAAAVLAAAVLAVRSAKNRRSQDAAESLVSSSGMISDGAAYKSISYHNGSATLSFALNKEGAWYWTDDPDFPLNQDYLIQMTNTLSTLKPQQTITDGGAPEDYGLSEPTRTLSATASNGLLTTLALGNATSDGNSYYMLMNESETPIFIISGELVKEMSVGIYDMLLLPELPALTEDRLGTVTLTGAVTTELSAFRAQAQPDEGGDDSSPESGGSVTWLCNGADVTGDEQVQSVLEQLSKLRLDACVDYRPSDGAAALCGFDEPAATVTVSYTGDGNTSQTLTLTVGNPVLGGDERYVRVNDDSTIYRIGEDKLDALLAVAGSGLDAASSGD